MLGPIVEGERIRLVPPTPEMLPQYAAWFANREVTRFMGVPYPPSLVGETAWFERIAASDSDIVWAVMLGDRHIGGTGIHRINWPSRRAITGNFIGEVDEWGKGYGSEAVLLRTRYAFMDTTLEKLESMVFMDNIGSRRALEKAGYRQYGVARRHEWRGGKWHDMWLADILRDEWAAQNLQQ